MKELKRLYTKNIRVLREDGVREWLREIGAFIPHLFRKFFSRKIGGPNTIPKDVLFISGLASGAPMRYRCTYQAEQLELHGLTTEILFFGRISNAFIVDYYDVIILYRVPLTDTLRAIIERAKQQNKLVVYDVDDLVFDAQYLAGRSEIESFNSIQREKYFSGVDRHRAAMELCDYGMASTEAIAREMRTYVDHVFVNRNSIAVTMREIAQNTVKRKKANDEHVVIGYCSGSATHNDDLQLIAQPLATILKKFPQAQLLLVGPVSLPEELQSCRQQILRKPFVAWDKLPELLGNIDINLAPLTDTLFSNAKSEIKFTEAAIVGTPTVASAREAFVHAIHHAQTGFLCDTEEAWVEALELLITSVDKREMIGKVAQKDVLARYTTDVIGESFVNFLQKNRAQKVVYVAPSTRISGGVMVIAHHLQKLQDRGYNTLFVAQVDAMPDMTWFGNFRVPVLPYRQFMQWKSGILDHCVATMWSSVKEILRTTAKKKYYFVQGKEFEFYDKNHPHYAEAKKSYHTKGISYFTVSPWCQEWLQHEFQQSAVLVQNGLDTSVFDKRGAQKEPLPQKKTRIIIEGNPKDAFKNVDESFRIVELLNRAKYEVWFISYGATPKKWYDYDKFFHNVAYKDMPAYYRSCHILLKTSRLESFSYPPLEMMACGGIAIIAKNPGNAAYIQNDVNAQSYEIGNVEHAAQLIETVSVDMVMQKKLQKEGQHTASQWDWEQSIDRLEKIFNFK